VRTESSEPRLPPPPHWAWRLAIRGRLPIRLRYLLPVVVVYLALAILGVYADWSYLSRFGISYLTYARVGDYLLAPLAFLRLALDFHFILAFMVAAPVLTLLVKAAQARWPDDPTATPRYDVLPFVETFRSHLWTLLHRRRRIALILGIAAIPASEVSAALEAANLRSYAEQVQYGYTNGRYQELGPPSSRYEVVALWTVRPAEPKEHLVRLRATSSYVFYYDVLHDAPVVVPASDILHEIAELYLEPEAAAGAGVVQSVGATAVGRATEAAEGISGPVAHADVAGQPPRGGIGTTGRGALTLSLQGVASDRPVSSAAPAPKPSALAAVGNDSRTTPTPNQAGVIAIASAGQAGSVTPQPSAAPGPTLVEPPAPEPAAPRAVTPGGDMAVIADKIRDTREALQGLKSYMQQLESSLKQINQAFDQLAAQQAAAERVAYADCLELSAGHPIEFGADDATLSLEAVGWLFQSRRQLTAPRSAERQEWLVIEGHADTSGQPSGKAPLAIRRADAVRDFLQSQLGVSPNVIRVVGKSAEGSNAGVVSLYDCLKRQPAAALPTTAIAETGVVHSASAVDAAGDSGPVGPAGSKPAKDAGRLSVMLADLNPRANERGLLVTVPGSQLFDNNSTQISSDAVGMLGEIGRALTHEPDRHAVIIGHTDSYGDAAYNQILSLRRARAVRDFLVANFGIASDRLSVEGRGEDEPVATDDTQAGRLANRRIEVLFLD
jgi:outer membrane protein OmpA-like peptidoglycan-associated protein